MISHCGTAHSSVSSSGLGSGRGYGAVTSPPLQQGAHINFRQRVPDENGALNTLNRFVELPSTPQLSQIIFDL
jgi:hypothetical protein